MKKLKVELYSIGEAYEIYIDGNYYGMVNDSFKSIDNLLSSKDRLLKFGKIIDFKRSDNTEDYECTLEVEDDVTILECTKEKANKFLKFYVDEDNQLQVEIIENDGYVIEYETLREAVGNSFDIVTYVDFGKENLAAYVDDEGILKHQKPTFWLLDGQSVYEYPLVGNVVVVKHEDLRGDGLDSVCLSDEEIELVCGKILTDGRNHYFLCMDQLELEKRNEFYQHLKKAGFKFTEVKIDDDFSL